MIVTCWCKEQRQSVPHMGEKVRKTVNDIFTLKKSQQAVLEIRAGVEVICLCHAVVKWCRTTNLKSPASTEQYKYNHHHHKIRKCCLHTPQWLTVNQAQLWPSKSKVSEICHNKWQENPGGNHVCQQSRTVQHKAVQTILLHCYISARIQYHSHSQWPGLRRRVQRSRPEV